MPVTFLNQNVVCDPSYQPGTTFNNCDPLLILSRIDKVGIGNPQGADFTDITNVAELMARISQTELNNNNTIRELTVTGEKPAASLVSITAAGGIKVTVAKDNSLNATFDQITDENWNYADYLDQHPGQKLYYWVTQSGKMFHFGGKGIPIQVAVTDNFPTGENDVITVLLALTWRSQPGLAKIADYPLQTGTAPTTPTLTNPTATVTNLTNTSLRLNRTNSPNATSYDFQLYTDAARTQLAKPVQTIPATGNAYADFTGLTAGVQYFGRVKPSAPGYSSPNGGTVSATTTNNMVVKFFLMPPNTVTALPTVSAVNGITGAGFPLHGPVVADFEDGNPSSRPTLAVPFVAGGFAPIHWQDTNNSINQGPIGTSTAGQTPTDNVWDYIGSVGAGANQYNIYQTTSNTDFDGTTVSFNE